MTETRQEKAEKFEDQIREWTGRIDDLKSKADQAPAKKKIGMLNQIAELNRRKAALMARFDKLKQSGDDDWDRVQTAVEQEVADLDEAYREAIRYFH